MGDGSSLGSFFLVANVVIDNIGCPSRFFVGLCCKVPILLFQITLDL